MRDYKRKMNDVRLPKERIAALKAFCLNSAGLDRDIIEAAAYEASDEVMGGWIVRHVISTDWTWARMEANGIPCNQDSFRLYRARFFFRLNRKLEMIGKLPPCGSAGKN